MKILISPTKDMNTIKCAKQIQENLFKNKSDYLFNHIKQYNVDQIHNRFKISFALAKKVYDYYHGDYNYVRAIDLYQGTVFKALKLDQYTKLQHQYINDKIHIFSGLYGLLRSNDTIKPYRLDMLTNIDMNLYDYYGESINTYLGDELLINLASKEFSKLIKSKNMITIDFVEIKGGKNTRNAMHCKMARGAFLHQCIIQEVDRLDILKAISVDNYVFNDDLSTSTNYVYIRKFISNKPK